jgi:DNA gyrase inhibitor GyrI
MSELTLQVERLEPCRVAVFTVTSPSPEEEAINALLGWARPQGLLDGEFRFFGYDNCQPNPNHTYTTWLTVGSDAKPSGAVQIRDFPGGKYVVAEVRSVEQIGPGWDALARLCAEQGYRLGANPCLEEMLDILGDVPLDQRRIRLMHAVVE